MDQATIEEERGIIVANGGQDKGVYRLIELGEQSPGEGERLLLKNRMITNREIEARHLAHR